MPELDVPGRAPGTTRENELPATGGGATAEVDCIAPNHDCVLSFSAPLVRWLRRDGSMKLNHTAVMANVSGAVMMIALRVWPAVTAALPSSSHVSLRVCARCPR